MITGEDLNLSVSTFKRAAYLAIRDMIVELEIPPGAGSWRTISPPG